MTEHTLTLRELNRATLARQSLLERARSTPTAMIERLVGVQAQWPAAPYVGIWTRTSGFERQRLERALARGTVLKTTVMRQTLHLVSRRDYPMFRAALSESNHPDQWPDAKLVAAAVRALAERGPVTNDDVLALLERDFSLTGVRARRAWRGARVRMHIVHHHETALWSARPGGRFVALDVPPMPEPLEARARLLRRFLTAFGPASRQDIDLWSMMRMPQILPALERREPLRRFRDERGRELLDVPRGELPDPDTPVPVRFLPKWDNVLLAYVDRSRVLPEAYRKAVIGTNGDVAQTFLADGTVRGTWRVRDGKVVVEPFTPLPRAIARAIRDEAAELEAFHRR